MGLVSGSLKLFQRQGLGGCTHRVPHILEEIYPSSLSILTPYAVVPQNFLRLEDESVRFQSALFGRLLM